MQHRREFLRTASGLIIAAAGPLLPCPGFAGQPSELAGVPTEAALMEALPGKFPLIRRTSQPPNFETPLDYFREAFTPNRAFFVRYHLSRVPEVDARDWRLSIGGDGAHKQVQFSLEQLKTNFEQVAIAAVCQCAGNRRGLFQPAVHGLQWGYGAMGNARWKGVRLSDVLAKAGIAKDAIEVAFNGTDMGLIDKTPDFVKSLPLGKALDENTLLAFEMNGAPLPHWNGYPVRLVVPGWSATYWMKHLTAITLLTKPFDGFWMKTAYRVPNGTFPMMGRFASQENEINSPVTEIAINSLITSMKNQQRFRRGQSIEVAGIAWDAGYGIRFVEVSTDGGTSWRQAELGQDYGRYSWRQWRFNFWPVKSGQYAIMAKATNRSGNTQSLELVPNPGGYHHNVVQTITIEVA